MFELFQLPLGQHTRHQLKTRRMMRVYIPHLEALVAQPVLHHGDLILLREFDSLGQQMHGLPVALLFDQHGHL